MMWKLLSIEEIKERLKKATPKIEAFYQTPKRMKNWKKRQIKGGKANKGKPKSPEHLKNMEKAQQRRRAREASKDIE